MTFLDDIIAGYSTAKAGAKVFDNIRSRSEDFFCGRETDEQGRDVYTLLKVARESEMTWQNWTQHIGFAIYAYFHPVQTYRDDRTENDIIMSEVRLV